MLIRYLATVHSPDCIAGRENSERDLLEHLARQLVDGGYAVALEDWPAPPEIPIDGEVIEPTTLDGD